MVRMAIRIEVAGIRHGHVTHDVNGLHARGVGVVIQLDGGADARYGCTTRNIVPYHRPPVILKISLQLGQFSGQSVLDVIVNQKHHFAPVLHGGQFDPRRHVTSAHVTRRAHHFVLVIGTNPHIVVRELVYATTNAANAGTPGLRIFQFSVDGVIGRTGIGLPRNGDPCRVFLHRCRQFHSIPLGIRLRKSDGAR